MDFNKDRDPFGTVIIRQLVSLIIVGLVVLSGLGYLMFANYLWGN